MFNTTALKKLAIFQAIGGFFSMFIWLFSAGEKTAKSLDNLATNLEASTGAYTEVSAITRETERVQAVAKANAKRLKAEAKLKAKATKLSESAE